MVRRWVGSHIEWKFSFIPESIRIWDGDVCVKKVFHLAGVVVSWLPSTGGRNSFFVEINYQLRKIPKNVKELRLGIVTTNFFLFSYVYFYSFPYYPYAGTNGQIWLFLPTQHRQNTWKMFLRHHKTFCPICGGILLLLWRTNKKNLPTTPKFPIYNDLFSARFPQLIKLHAKRRSPSPTYKSYTPWYWIKNTFFSRNHIASLPG